MSNLMLDFGGFARRFGGSGGIEDEDEDEEEGWCGAFPLGTQNQPF
jgi:hypothetical protein